MENTANNQENIILWDWFSLTSKYPDTYHIKKLLGLEKVKWSKINGAHGYLQREYFDGISIHYDLSPLLRDSNPYRLWLEMSGQGCRAFETYGNGDWSSLFSLCNDPCYHLTRLDVAYDDWTGLLDLQKIDKECSKGNFRQLFNLKNSPFVEKAYWGDSITIYFGSKKSNVLFRCYNKKEERNRDDVDHWVRFELQLRDDAALLFLNTYLDSEELGSVFSGYVSKYFNFLKPSKTDSNKARWQIAEWWLKFLGDCTDIPCYTRKDVDYNIYKLDHLIFNTFGNAVEAALKVHGISEFLELLRDRKIVPNPKYQRIIDGNKFKRACENSDDIIEVLAKCNML